MTHSQIVVFGILSAALVLFIWGRWRYDLVCLMALVASVLLGVVPAKDAFAGFGHPAVITVAAVLVLSKGLINARVVDSLARVLGRVGDSPTIQVAALMSLVALASAVMNNVGALALLMPVAIWMSRQSGRSPAILLMPLAFGSLLGGTMTLIGTPPNIIIAGSRAETGPGPFGMFDFLPVGLTAVVAGVLVTVLFGWKWVPVNENAARRDDLLRISNYLSEWRVPDTSPMAGRTIHDLLNELQAADIEVVVLGLIRDGRVIAAPSSYEVLHAEDGLLLEGDVRDFARLAEVTSLVPVSPDSRDTAEAVPTGDGVELMEVVVTSGSPLVGQSNVLGLLRDHHGINLLAVARHGHRLGERLGQVKLTCGDILLVQGHRNSISEDLARLGLMPLAERGLQPVRPPRVLLGVTLFGAAILVVALNLLPASVAFTAGAVAMVLAGLLTLSEAYESIDWSIIVLLGAMVPVGQALETSGGAQLIAEGLMHVAGTVPPAMTIALLMVATMLLSNVINNAATAILAAPIALRLAQGMGVSPDPLLMAVAIGSSCAFLTPIGHQSNTLVMEPGGYRFSDYWRLGLPVSLAVVLACVPVILWVWPLHP